MNPSSTNTTTAAASGGIQLKRCTDSVDSSSTLYDFLDDVKGQEQSLQQQLFQRWKANNQSLLVQPEPVRANPSSFKSAGHSSSDSFSGSVGHSEESRHGLSKQNSNEQDCRLIVRKLLNESQTNDSGFGSDTGGGTASPPPGNRQQVPDQDPSFDEAEALEYAAQYTNNSNSSQTKKQKTGHASSDGTFKEIFRFMVDGPKRAKTQVVELSEKYSERLYPRRVLLADHVKRWFPRGKPAPVDKSGKPLPPYTYRFILYDSVRSVIKDLLNLPPADRTLFAVIEESGAVFAYFDLEIPSKQIDSRVHGSSMLNYFGYCFAVARSLLSQILGTNLCCWSDSPILFESEDVSKWSAHLHIGWPFRNIAALRSIMGTFKDRLWEMFHAGVTSVIPLFYLSTDKVSGESTVKCAIDLGVFTKKRNFRLPECTKREKDAFLRCANTKLPRWNRPGETPCAVVSIEQKVRIPPDQYALISTGFILARNSYAFWNPITIRFSDVLEQHEKAEANHNIHFPVLHPKDVRCLPDNGLIKTCSLKIHKLLEDHGIERWSDKLTTAELDLIITVNFEAVFQAYYEQSWIELVGVFRNNTSIKPAISECIHQLYALCRQSPTHLVVSLLCWTQLYRPGLGLDQESVRGFKKKGGPPVLKLVHHHASRIADAILRDTPVFAWSHVYALFFQNETTLSGTNTEAGIPARTEFLKSVGQDFLANYLTKRVFSNAYMRSHLLDPFVLFSLAPAVILASGYHIHSMQRITSSEQEGLDQELWFLPASYPIVDTQPHKLLIKSYDHTFLSVLKREGKHTAPRVAQINTLRLNEDTTVVFNVHAKNPEKEDLLTEHIPRLRKKLVMKHKKKKAQELQIEEDSDDEDSSSSSSDGEEMYFCVPVRHKLPEQEA